MKSLMYKRIWFVVLILCFVQGAYPQNHQSATYREALKSQQKMLATIIDKLHENRRSAIIELNGRCYVNTIARSSPTRVIFHGVPDDLTNLLAGYGHFDVRDKEGAAIVIREHNIASDVLDIVLPSVALDLRDRNDSNAAVGAILTNDAVTSVLARRHVLFVDSWEKLQTPPIPKPPLPSRSANASLEDTIQALLQAFPGVAVYQQCEKSNGERLIQVDFERY
jgi:hypothetical protein